MMRMHMHAQPKTYEEGELRARTIEKSSKTSSSGRPSSCTRPAHSYAFLENCRAPSEKPAFPRKSRLSSIRSQRVETAAKKGALGSP
eukprot:3392227-Pleurochrysis_carterae.AAC.1